MYNKCVWASFNPLPPYPMDSNWPTIPQLYVNGEFVGGCDILNGMHDGGDMLDQLVTMGAEFHEKL